MPNTFQHGDPPDPRASQPNFGGPAADPGVTNGPEVFQKSAFESAGRVQNGATPARARTWLPYKPRVRIQALTWFIALTASAGLWYLVIKAVILLFR